MTDVRRSSGSATNGAEFPDHDGSAASEWRGHPSHELDPTDGWTGSGPYANGRPARTGAWASAYGRANVGSTDVHAAPEVITAMPAAAVWRPDRLTGKVELVRPELADVLHITRNLRERDRLEVFATRWDDDPELLAASAMEIPGSLWVAKKGDTPVAIFGARPMWPGVWCAYAFGTDHWPEVVLTMTRHIMRFIIPSLTPRAHLVVAFCHEDHVSSIRWLRSMGAATVAPMLFEWGRERENFVLLGWRA